MEYGDPSPISQRISRQSGKFSFHPEVNSGYISNLKRRDGEELIKIVLKNMKIDKCNRLVNPSSEIRAHLGIMNIHHAALFPDSVGVAKFINHEWPIISS